MNKNFYLYHFIFILIFNFFICENISFAKIGRDEVRLIPGAPEYESYMNKKDCAETINGQRTWIYSALLPGLGQIHNHQLIRAAVIWGGFIGLFGGIYYCHNEYTKYFQKDSLNPPNFINTYKIVRNSLLFISMVWYIANIFDAYVGAKLLAYDISDNIAVQVVPIIDSSLSKNSSIGMAVGFSLK